MKYIKLFEDFKFNNNEGVLISIDDIRKCIRKNGLIYTNIVKNYPDNKNEVGIKPVSIDDDGLITVEIDGNEYSVDIKDVQKIEN